MQLWRFHRQATVDQGHRTRRRCRQFCSSNMPDILISIIAPRGDKGLLQSIMSRNELHPSSDTGSVRNPLAIGKLFGVRETTTPLATFLSPMIFRTKSRFAVSLSDGSSVHFASKSSSLPPTPATKSTSRVQSRQKNRLPVRPPRRSPPRS